MLFRSRSGVGVGVDVYAFVEGLDADNVNVNFKSALESALAADVDVVLMNYWSSPDAACDGVAPAGLESAVYDAAMAGMPVIMSAGNLGEPPNNGDNQSSCSIRGGQDTYAGFLVGNASGGGASPCTAANWASCPVSVSSRRAGYDVVNDLPQIGRAHV